jgi:hypothetical protein
MAQDIKKIRKFVDDNYGITCAKLIDADVIKLAKQYLLGMSIETPRIAKIHADELNLSLD